MRTTTEAGLPDLPTLTARLSSLEADRPGSARPVTVLRREENVYESTFPSEVVTCRLADGSERRLLCKYAAGRDHNVYGHRGGVAYEAQVYRQVLQPLGASTPRFYGASQGTPPEEAWLVLEFLDRGEMLSKTENPDEALALAAHWLGRFHAAAEVRLARVPLPALRSYDLDYYRGWARRTLQFTRPWRRRFPWLAALCRHWDEGAALLLAPPRTVIHGEFYPRNILFHEGEIRPIDWESAAVGAGSIDLAAVTEGWPAEYVQACFGVYCGKRWPGGPPAGFASTLLAAELYLLFRWLGDREEWTYHEGAVPSLARLRATGERLGLI